MKYIFLDFDGVLNDHTVYENGYTGTKPSCVRVLNSVLREYPDTKLVIISSWRYLVHSGQMTLKGFESLMLTHGINAHNRVIGLTREDRDDTRYEQILDWLNTHDPNCQSWISLDDNYLSDDPRCVLTNGRTGLCLT